MKSTNNYPAMVALANDIGTMLEKVLFRKNMSSQKVRRENYHTNYIRRSADENFIHVASVSIYCRLPRNDEIPYLAPMAATIEAGVELRAALSENFRPEGARDEMKLTASDCTFQVPQHFADNAVEVMREKSMFDVPSCKALVILPKIEERAMAIQELIEFFSLSTDTFFREFSLPFPFDQILLEDIQELHRTRTCRFSRHFETSAFRLAGAAEAYWKMNQNIERANQFKEIRRAIFNSPVQTISSWPKNCD